ncbi:unnamed protein product [Effrenium voratum]|uniref:Uncharacterized protein n=1 Tax=Effrenium voratum TaxID=2562239 RepID=A0AA36N680_9DINO|nr:unnamed protein product [Effrenium voratum]
MHCRAFSGCLRFPRLQPSESAAAGCVDSASGFDAASMRWLVAWAPAAWAVPAWWGEPSGRYGYEMAQALRRGFAVLDLGAESAAIEVFAQQNSSSECAEGPQEHLNVLDTKSQHWSPPPCYEQDDSDSDSGGPLRLMAQLQQVARWAVRAAASHDGSPVQGRWLERALEEMNSRRELLRAFAYRGLGSEAVAAEPLNPRVPSKALPFRAVSARLELVL